MQEIVMAGVSDAAGLVPGDVIKYWVPDAPVGPLEIRTVDRIGRENWKFLAVNEEGELIGFVAPGYQQIELLFDAENGRHVLAD